MYELKLSAILDSDLMKEHKGFMKQLKEARHMKVMEHQKMKFENLGHRKQHSGSTNSSSKSGTGGCSNQDQFSTVKQWVVNVSSNPLSVAQESVLSHGPNFPVTTKTPISRIYNGN